MRPPTSGLRGGLIAVLAAIALLAVWPSPALASTTIYVSDSTSFEHAVATLRQTGGRIVLRAHVYTTQLVVGPRSNHFLTIVGATGARVQSLYLDGTQSVAVTHLSVHPETADGGIVVLDSLRIVLTQLALTANATRRNMEVRLNHSTDVTFRGNNVSHCGDLSLEWSLCLLLVYPSHVNIEGNYFHDCRGCDFIHGFAGKDVNIRGNEFDRALRCGFALAKCVHQDMIELFAADGLFVLGNRFGVSQRGGAQLYLTSRVNYVRVVNNLFRRSDPRVPGVHSPTGVVVGVPVSRIFPKYVEILNNTIMSGIPLSTHAAASIVLAPGYRFQPVAIRPLIVNNILYRLDDRNLVCPDVRASIRNVVVGGSACSTSDRTGTAYLDSEDRPTAASALLIDRASAVWAPPTDLIGRLRGSAPDIGCYEYFS